MRYFSFKTIPYVNQDSVGKDSKTSQAEMMDERSEGPIFFTFAYPTNEKCRTIQDTFLDG